MFVLLDMLSTAITFAKVAQQIARLALCQGSVMIVHLDMPSTATSFVIQVLTF